MSYHFAPLKDITAYELAEILARHQMMKKVPGGTVAQLSSEARRHFVETAKIEESDAA